MQATQSISLAQVNSRRKLRPSQISAMEPSLWLHILVLVIVDMSHFLFSVTPGRFSMPSGKSLPIIICKIFEWLALHRWAGWDVSFYWVPVHVGVEGDEAGGQCGL